MLLIHLYIRLSQVIPLGKEHLVIRLVWMNSAGQEQEVSSFLVDIHCIYNYPDVRSCRAQVGLGMEAEHCFFRNMKAWRLLKIAWQVFFHGMFFGITSSRLSWQVLRGFSSPIQR